MVEWIIGLIERHGYLAIAALMVLENLFPPVPSELIMPFAGYVAGQGTLHPAGVVAAGVIGSLGGMLPWYWVGRRIGSARLTRWTCRHGRWLALSPRDLEQAQRWFGRHGTKAVFLGRMVPGLRTLVSLPAGIGEMPFGRFVGWSAAGVALWVTGLTAVGHTLGERWGDALRVLEPVAHAVVGLAVLTYLWRVLRWRDA